MNKDQERLLAVVIDKFAQEFGKQAILRGGMVLKAIGSLRHTNDVDYLFVPFKSKKDIVSQILNCLQKMSGVSIKHSLNSKCLRIHLTKENTTIQIEAKVARESKVDIISTKLISTKFDLPIRAIYIVDHSVSLANKLAAWNERRLARDLYDILFFIQMDIQADKIILEKRLNKPEYSKLIKSKDYFEGKEVEEFYEFLRNEVNKISEKKIIDELLDYLPPKELIGIKGFLVAALIKLK